MFLINPYLRIALMSAGILGGILLSVFMGFWYGFPFWLIGLFLLAGYLLLGTVGSAAKALQDADLVKTEKMLGLTVNPKWLYATNRAYFYMLKGSLALANKDTENGEKYLEMAEKIKLQTDNEKAMIQLQLANIAANKGNWAKAQLYMRTLSQLKITEPNLKEQVKQFEKAVNNRGQVKAAQRMGMMTKGGGMQMPGGKRRRPKMR